MSLFNSEDRNDGTVWKYIGTDPTTFCIKGITNMTEETDLDQGIISLGVFVNGSLVEGSVQTQTTNSDEYSTASSGSDSIVKIYPMDTIEVKVRILTDHHARVSGARVIITELR